MLPCNGCSKLCEAKSLRRARASFKASKSKGSRAACSKSDEPKSKAKRTFLLCRDCRKTGRAGNKFAKACRISEKKLQDFAGRLRPSLLDIIDTNRTIICVQGGDGAPPRMLRWRLVPLHLPIRGRLIPRGTLDVDMVLIQRLTRAQRAAARR